MCWHCGGRKTGRPYWTDEDAKQVREQALGIPVQKEDHRQTAEGPANAKFSSGNTGGRGKGKGASMCGKG